MDSDLDRLGECIAEQAAHFDAAMHRLLTDLRSFDLRGGWHRQGAKSCAHWLSWRVGWDLATSRDRLRVARKLADFALIDDALRRGELSYSKIRAMVRVATALNEPMLLDCARLMPAAQLEKLCRKYEVVQRHGEDVRPHDDVQRRFVRRRDTDDGMVRIEAVLQPEEAELVWSTLNHATTRLSEQPGVSAQTPGPPQGTDATAPVPTPSVLKQRDDAAKRAFNRADGLVALAQGYLRGDRQDRSPIEVVITIPQASLRADGQEPAKPGVAHSSSDACLGGGSSYRDAKDPVEVGEIGESFISVESARRLSCDAGVVEVVVDDHGTPLSVGRKRRTISGALKRALHQRDSMCVYPGCTHRMFLEGHHIKHWADGGETSLTNGILLCSWHHRHVHEHGYTIELDAEQRPQFRDRHGWVVPPVPPRPRTELAWLHILDANAGLGIDANTIACKWDGTPVDYGAVVGCLVGADRLN